MKCRLSLYTPSSLFGSSGSSEKPTLILFPFFHPRIGDFVLQKHYFFGAVANGETEGEVFFPALFDLLFYREKKRWRWSTILRKTTMNRRRSCWTCRTRSCSGSWRIPFAPCDSDWLLRLASRIEEVEKHPREAGLEPAPSASADAV